MNKFSLTHSSTKTQVATVERADGFWMKGKGVIGRLHMPCRSGVWLPDVASVHTCFVRFSMDILFLNVRYETLSVMRNVAPWRLLVRSRGATHTVELGSGTLESTVPNLQIGDRWQLDPIADAGTL